MSVRPTVSSTDLLEWGAQHRRALPWRDTRDPWSIHVSEVMLQQTQVDRVVPKYLAFLERFGSVADCAAGAASEVIRLWDGLGYNRRALHLHRAASAVVERFDGEYPTELGDLMSLPGVGPYTARAIMTFAFEFDVGVVDTNVGRVLARIGGQRLLPNQAQAIADDLVPIDAGWAWNQAMFDLGALVCHRRNPDCGACPVSGSCRWQSCGPDPADSSAGVSGGQSRFDGSDRQGRGKLIKALRSQRQRRDQVAELMGWPTDPERAERVLEGLLRDGMVRLEGQYVTLPVD